MSDLISRQAAISTVFSICCRWDTDDPDDLKNMLMRAFQDLPSADRPTGEWIKATGVAPPEFAGRYVCSNCGNYALKDMPYGSRQELSHFCPNCGNYMRGE